MKNRLIIKIHPPLFNNRGGLFFILLLLMVLGEKNARRVPITLGFICGLVKSVISTRTITL